MATTTPLFHVQSNAESELQVVMLVAMDFFSETLPGLAWIIGLLLAAVLVTWLVVSLWACAFHKCGAGSCFTQISQYVIGILLLLFGFSIAFGSVGISFLALFAGASFVAGAFVYSAADFTKDFIVGIQLLTFGTLDKHYLVKLDGVNGVEGHLRGIGLFTSELVPVVTTGLRNEGEKDVANGFPDVKVVKTTIFVPNRLLLAGPLEVTYNDKYQRTTERGSLVTGKTHTAVRRGASEQRAAYDIDAGTATRWPESSAAPTPHVVSVSRFDGTPSSGAREEHARRFIEQAGLSRRTPAASVSSSMASALVHRRLTSPSSSSSSSSAAKLVFTNV